MKICFCTQNMAPFRMKWMDEIAKVNEVHIYHLGEYEKGLNPNYISYEPTGAKIFLKRRKLFGKNIFQYTSILKERPDLYLLDGYGFFGQQLLILLLSILNIPFIMSIDGGFINKGESILKKIIKTFFISSASAYLSTSEETDNYIKYYGGEGKIMYRHYFSNLSEEYLVEHPLDAEHKNELKSTLGLKNAFTVLSVGKLFKGKGFDLLLKAVKEVDLEIQVILIGTECPLEYKDLLEELSDKVKVFSFCNSEALKKYYSAADLFLLPTRSDVWGLVISEAMANAIPVVTTNMCLAGVAMLPDDDIIPIDDVSSISRQINRYYEMSFEERTKIGKRNLDETKKYTISESVKNDICHFQHFLESI